MTSIVKSVSVDNLVNQRAAVVEKIKAALAALDEARELALAAHVGFPRILIDEPKFRARIGDIESQDIIKLVDRGAWQYLMAESGMRSFMDAEARKKWDESIEKGDFPEVTIGNVEATFRMLYDSRLDLFERGVIKCFTQLSWCYKTNRPFAFGKRIVLRFLRHSVTGPGRSLGHVAYRTADELDDLSRAFSLLDGQPEPDHRSGWYARLNRADSVDNAEVADTYIRVKSFRNGNGHATFLRPDLVATMNRILAKHYPGALPADPYAEAA